LRRNHQPARHPHRRRISQPHRDPARARPARARGAQGDGRELDPGTQGRLGRVARLFVGSAGCTERLSSDGMSDALPIGLARWPAKANNRILEFEHMATHAPEMPIEVDSETGVWTTDALPMLYVPRHFFVNNHIGIEEALGA